MSPLQYTKLQLWACYDVIFDASLYDECALAGVAIDCSKLKEKQPLYAKLVFENFWIMTSENLKSIHLVFGLTIHVYTGTRNNVSVAGCST